MFCLNSVGCVGCVAGKAPANRRSVQAPSPTSEQRPSGPTPGSSDYFRRYLGGRRALSAHAGSSSSSSSGSNSNTRASISSAQPVGRAPSIAGELPSSSAGLSPKEQNKAKRLIGEAMANNQSGRRKEVRKTLQAFYYLLGIS